MCNENIKEGDVYEYVLNDHKFIVTAIQLDSCNGEGPCWVIRFNDSGCITKALARDLRKPD